MTPSWSHQQPQEDADDSMNQVIINSFLYAAHLANCLQDDAIRPLFLVIYAGGMP